uniref:Spaetzle domain-containing protein n=1 Tax=Anopheles culicifacies TaxID=139723 RepID=A0A182M796_9DIPT
MAHHKISRALLILFTFQLYIDSLNANPQTFGPLIRDRAIRDRQQTSEEDLNANIERIFHKDLKMTTSHKDQSTDEVEPSPTELVSRSYAGGTLRPKRPSSSNNNRQNAMLLVIRDADGKLVPQFSNNTKRELLTSAPKEDPHSSNEFDGSLVLKLAPGSDLLKNPVFENGSYPEDYPHDMINRILESHKGLYDDWFEDKIKREPLATRTNSEADMYLCSSSPRTEYPTFIPAGNRYIINVQGFYQPVVFELCNGKNSNCSKSTTTARNYELKCVQTYRNYKLFAAPARGSNTNKFEFIDIRYPACCKCAQISKGAK